VSSDFKELNLDRTRLQESVQAFWNLQNCSECQYNERLPKKTRVEYIQDNCNVMVEFLFRTNGTTTIHTKLGKSQDKGSELAFYLKQNLVEDERRSVFITVKDIDQSTFDLLLEFLKELYEEDVDIAKAKPVLVSDNEIQMVVKATSQYNDSLSLTHYKTKNKLLIQGKPLYTYSQVCYFLSEFTNLNGFLAIVQKGEEDTSLISVDSDSIEGTLQSLLPNTYFHLGDGILKMLRTSYALKDLPISLEDYSSYVFPALRALEGVIKKMLFIRGHSEGRNGYAFGRIFWKDTLLGKYSVKPQFTEHFDDPEFCNALELCYNYYNQQRHGLFHAEEFTDASRFIETQELASQIIDEVVRLIDSNYKIVI
jgi:hypothetical protein